MAETIAKNLLDFKNSVSPKLDIMEGKLTELSDKITESKTAASAAKDGIDSVYSSQNKSVVISKFVQIENTYSKISSSLSGDLYSILRESRLLVEKVSELEELNSKIESKAAYVNGETDVDKKTNATNDLNSLRSSFRILNDEATKLYSKLKTMDSKLSFVNEFTSLDMSNLSEHFVGSDVKKYSYKASNGQVVEYYLYVPQYDQDVNKLPVHIYLHGYGEFVTNYEKGTGQNDKVLGTSLPKLLSNGMKANGIVICPQGRDEQKNWNDKAYQDALIELTNKIVAENNADPDRISLSGHSQGAIGGYSIISRNPGYFSAFLPISGHNKKMEQTGSGWKALGQIPIWAFHGTNDTAVDYSLATGVLSSLKQMGSNNMQIHTFNGAGHNIQTQSFSNEYVYDGKSYNPLTWAFLQRRNG